MNGEGPRLDYKVTLDLADREARLRLVKDIIAIANAGGGVIVFGRDDTEVYGIEPEVAKALDSARLADEVDKFARPAKISLSHETQQLAVDCYLVSIHVAAAREYPIVMAEDGNSAGATQGKTKHVFVKGDIWTRHSSKTERATYEDLRHWIDHARQVERDTILSRINKVISIPDGADIQIVVPSAVPALDTPQRTLEYATKRRAHKSSYVLSGDDLLELFLHRSELKDTISQEELSLILASALRRPTTLFWWLPLIESDPELILLELHNCLAAADRDKSDAASSVIELAAIYAGDDQLEQVIAELRASRYLHFREAVLHWNGRAAQRARLRDRVERARYDKRLLCEMEIDELELLATESAVMCLENGSAQARRLGDITRVLWYHQSAYAAHLRV